MRYILTSNSYLVTKQWAHEFEMNPSELTVAFIDTAADVYNKAEAEWLQADRKALVDEGFTVTDYSLVDKTRDDLMTDLSPFDVFFVSGGNTFFLLEHANKSGFIALLSENFFKNTLYVGSSAGSVLLSTDIEPIKFLDDPSVTTLTQYDGVGIFDGVIFPHWGSAHFKKKYLQALPYAYEHGFSGLLLADHQYLTVDEKGMRLVSVEM